MYRNEVVVRAMLPMALVALAIYDEIQRAESMTYFLLPIGLAFLGGRWAARRFDARLHELLAALGLSGVVAATYLGHPYWMLLVLFIGAIGLFLLPLFDSATRSDPEVALPMPQARNVGLALFGLFCLIGTIYEGGWQENLWYGAMMASWLCILGLLVALALVMAGKRKEGAWTGSVASLVIVLFLIALNLVGFPQY